MLTAVFNYRNGFIFINLEKMSIACLGLAGRECLRRETFRQRMGVCVHESERVCVCVHGCLCV